MLSRENLEGLRRRVATQVEDVHGVLQKLKAIEIREITRRAINGGKKKVPWRQRRMKKEKIPVKSGVVSHGHHVVERSPHQCVVVQKGRADLSELWFFAASDQHQEDGALKLLQAHLFEQELAGRNQGDDAGGACGGAPPGGLATAVLLEGEVLVAGGSGGYRTVVSRGGRPSRSAAAAGKGSSSAYQKLCRAGAGAGDCDDEKGRSPVAQAERMTSETEMMIIASGGVWEVMGNQEAVDLISHVEDAQEAARRLADEALARMTKSPVACIVVRFE
ncbi:unnamed protein product [Spirodela intermedia]|uniref:protein-serine/threonine phosphatase n=1 Tax=Spirodela intermedia TaxID=51605 RepID=A0A7I8IXE3_SPIIN|nr:unnamed protein product [Spirodela intermedia]CAA6662498.1 unnamed protein product [Spirodela intermedia]